MTATAVATRPYEKMGMSKGCEDHDRDLVHELDHRLDVIWRFDQYIANAEGNKKVQDLWRDLKRQEQENVKRIKDLIAGEIKSGCF